MAISKAEARARSLEERNDRDIVWLMSSEQGRRIMARLMAFSGFESLCMTGDEYTYFNDGKRAVGQHFYQAVLNLCPQYFIAMLEESKREIKETEEILNDPSSHQ